MQDRYAGDVGDYSKLVVARQLHREIGGPIGLIWYRFPDESHNNDGRHVSYVHDRRWQDCDPDLVASLEPIAMSQDRSIESLEQCGVLPSDTAYFGDPVHSMGHKRWTRDDWFNRARQAVSNCRIVVVDPDNGIAGLNHSTTSSKGGKHITHYEIRMLAEAHDCLVIYHHFDRSAPHPVQIERQMSVLRSLAPNSSIHALRYRRLSPRVYFVVTKGAFAVSVNEALKELAQVPWDFHFELFS